jgi:catechol 2,3-dioxygenase-like lactoylglutathione lyase family enzyme
MTEFEGQIAWVYCEDLAITSAFYSNVLGLELWRDAGTAQIFRSAPGAMIGVCRVFEGREVLPAGGMITLLISDVDERYELLKSRGARLLSAPEKLEHFGIYSFFCEDPNGYVIEIQRFLELDQARSGSN